MTNDTDGAERGWRGKGGTSTPRGEALRRGTVTPPPWPVTTAVELRRRNSEGMAMPVKRGERAERRTEMERERERET